jgi:N-formylglutamate amidohydrolase
MEGRFEPSAAVEPPIEIMAHGPQDVPLVLASPHSGARYPEEFLQASRLDPLTLRRSEDSFVDEIFDPGPEVAAPLLRACFPRAYLDPNREPFELDPVMFEDALPAYVNSRSPRVRVGLGTIARVVATGEEIYARKLRFADALERVERLYRPYHRALKQLLGTTRDRFGFYLLVDCHSMPSSIAQGDRGVPKSRADIVLGDCHGTSCHASITDAAYELLRAKGYQVTRNTPYAGGFTTAHYGKPQAGGHALQVELSRGLYMDELRFDKKPFLARLAADMRELVAALVVLDPAPLRPS